MVKRKTVGNVCFDVLNYLFLAGLALSCILPIVNLLAVSFSDSASTSANLVRFWPRGFNTASYEEVFRGTGFFRAFWIATMRTVIGSAVNLFMIITAAYPLSLSASQLKGRNFIILMYIFPMLFSGGLVPFFIVVNNVGLMRNFWVMIIPSAVPIFSIILMMNFFRNLPKQIIEAAFIDGCNHVQMLWKIYIPLSTASIATVALFAIVGHWNDWFTGLIFLRQEQYPLQTYLRQLLVQVNLTALTLADVERMRLLSDRSLRAAQLFLAIIPIMAIYPFLQKYFVTGITLGSVKE